MKLVTRAFHDWCQVHGIPLDKVVLVVRAHDEIVRDRIEDAVLRDFEFDMFDKNLTEVSGFHRLQLNDVRVSFSTLDRSK